MVCRVCLFSIMLCVSSLLCLQYMLCSLFVCPYVCAQLAFYWGYHPAASLPKRWKYCFLFFFFLSNMCWSETGCLNSIWKSCFFFLPLWSLLTSPSKTVCVCLVGSCQVTFVQGFKIPLLVLWLAVPLDWEIYALFADVVWTHSVNVWPLSQILQPNPSLSSVNQYKGESSP